MAHTYQYVTNGPEYDFPEYLGVPQCTYVVASSPRCGSNMLQRALWRTFKAGAPEEYLARGYISDFRMRWNLPEKMNCESLRSYVQMLMRHRTSDNGTFGIKVHGSHLASEMLNGMDLGELLPNYKLLVVRRADKVRQSVSYALARETGVWIRDGQWLPNKAPLTDEPEYKTSLLLDCLGGIEFEESVWDAYIEQRDLDVYTVMYEDLVEEFEVTIDRVLRFLGIRKHVARIVGPQIDPQTTAINDTWAKAFAAFLKDTAVSYHPRPVASSN